MSDVFGILEKLYQTDDRPAAATYPASVIDESILAFLMSKSASPSAASFDNTTDSLEALCDAIAAAQTDIGDPSARTNLQTLLALLGNEDVAGSSLWNALIGSINAVNRVVGKHQIFTKAITSAANAGDVTVATITTQACLIESVVVHSDGATTVDLTNIGVYGGASKVVTLITTVQGAKANIDVQDEQVSWTGSVYLPTNATIVITLTGTGATAVDLNVVVKYQACVNGGYLV